MGFKLGSFSVSTGGKAPTKRGPVVFGQDSSDLSFSLDSAPIPFLGLRGGSSASRAAGNQKRGNVLNSLALASLVDVEHFHVRRITGDGRCLFRALAQGAARSKGIILSSITEEMEADNLRMAVFESLCTESDKKQKFKAVITTINQTEDPLPKYCKRLKSPTFWGGEPELVVLSSLLRTPVYIYKSESEYGRSGTGFIKIVEYDAVESSKKPKKPVRLLYSGSNHYDLLTE